MTAYDLPAFWPEKLLPLKLLDCLQEDPRLGEPFNAQGRAINETVPARLLETIALRVASLRYCLYIWRGHTYLAVVARRVLSEDEIRQIVAGPHALSGFDALVVRAVDELLAGGLQPSTAEALGPRALQVTLTTMFYSSVAALMHGVEPESFPPPLPGLETPTVALRTWSEAS